MNGVTLMAIAIIVLGGAYLTYGRWLEKTWHINKERKTPAYELEDGVDYVPADSNIVFGHQFASIAGAGPINGPIQAAMFGWFPVLLWILVGGIFFGAVQDYVSMYASVRNKGKTIGYIIEKYIGKLGKKLFLVFCWLFCILVIAAFADIVAATFDGLTDAGENIVANGSVATTSLIFIIEAIVLGFVLKNLKLNKWANTAIALVLLVAGIYIGLLNPIFIDGSSWHLFVFIYIGIATIVPVWVLLQPRDYLNSYLLVAMILAAVVGVFVANPTINLESFTAFNVNGLNMFPFLFVTIACGAISGFHSLVSSGTSSKQIKNEKHMLPVSYGSMLLECLLAVIALIAVASFASGEAATSGLVTPSQIFAGAVANFLSSIGLPYAIIFTLINLAVSAFALTSLDSVARVARLSFQEFFATEEEEKSAVANICTNKYVATIATLGLAYLLAKVGYAAIWPLFGASNQLLAVIALLACAVYLKNARKKTFMLVIPIFSMILITFSALLQTIFNLGVSFMAGEATVGTILQFVFGILIFGLGVCVTFEGLKKYYAKNQDDEPITTEAF
ncbi:carbon starvation protein CstA [Candidatus Epulonipiscium fishelsonii]|uniref:Carbon starvation protein CstA n=1 Tax=Candidatus Epulonipiscium fishelsonii TaxID=77094 RepID=A0ACC8XBT8_9FIRM|nr:carbon starvation protein CstA [Epulopiscium sp. SCG-B11WGA-EpuloA1]ONI40270.1 carbon starvation protein CstA [Epulopiscium sp. SCG-B05WGA-EpuloA1]